MTLSFVIPELNIGGAGTPPLEFYRRGFNLGGSGSQPSWRDVILSGNTALTLVNAKADGLNYLKLFGGTEQRNLPEGYTQTAYTLFNTSAYLTTDFVPTYDCKVEFEFKTGSSIVNNATTYLGARSTSSGNDGLRVAHITSRVWRIYGFGTYADSTDLALPDTEYKFVYDNGHAVLTTGDTVVFDYTFTNTDENTYPVTINGWNSAGAVTAGMEPCYVYKLKCWDNQGNLSLDYVPATYNTSVGFYNNVGNSFKTATAGTLVAGAVATPTPDTPMDIISNNGVLKINNNLLNSDTNVSNEFINDTGEIGYNTGSFYSALIPVNPNTEYTFYRNAGAGSYPRMHAYDSNGNWLAMIAKGQDTQSFIISGTTTATTAFIRVTAKSASDMRVYLTDYSYGAVYVDGTTETVNVHSKNLCNLETPYVCTLSTPNYTDSLTPTWCKFKENTRYTITYRFTPEEVTYSAEGNLIFSVITYTDGTTDYNSGIKHNSLLSGIATYTTTAGKTIASIVGVYRHNRFTGGTITINSMQIEEGTTSTTYEQYYNGGTATVEMLLKAGNYQDVQEVLTGNVIRNVGVYVFDGTENISTSNVTFTILIRDKISSKIPLWCSHFEYSQKTSSQVEDLKIISFSSQNVGFRYDACANTTAFGNWLKSQYDNGTPVIIVYPLATSATETVTGQPLTIQAGTNIVEITQASMDNLELEVSYKAGVSVTVTEIENAQLDNSVEVTVNG